MKHILFLIGIVCYPFILQAQWYPVYVPTTQGLEAITFTDTLHGFITVADGSILETSNGGINWQTVLTGSGNAEMDDICFPTDSTGYSVGDNGHIVKTINAGSSWPLINSPTTDMLRGVSFLNPDTGFICGQQEIIYRTNNGGITWIQQNFGIYWLRKFSFPTFQIGYCAGDNHLVFKTTDGGLTWNQVSEGGPNLNGIQFLTVDTGYVCGANGYVAKSFNGGLTWQVLNTGTTKNFSGLWFFNSQAGYCVGDSGLILKTTNGGVTWTQETSGTNFKLYHLYFLHQYQGFICGDAGTLLENCLSSPGTIIGPSTVCQGDTGKIYSVNAVAGATGYNWNLPQGVIITSGSNTNIITVTYTATSVSGSITVYAYNAICNGTTSLTFPVIVNTAPLPAINGSAQACSDSAFNYTTQAGMNNYFWNISSGGIITSGGTSTDNSVTVIWNTVGLQNVSVNYTNANGCTGAAPAIVNVTVNQNLPAGITITASVNPFCPGSAVTFSATPTNGGTAPSYQWKVNGANAGTNSSTFTYNPNNNDSVRCVMTSNLACVTGSPASSAEIIMSGTLAPIVTFTACFDTITTVNAKPIKLKGGIPLGGIYSGPGVNSLTGIFTPSVAGTGTKTITYSYTNVVMCTASKSIHIIVQAAPSFSCGNEFTDIRDNKVYPTVQIGTQCWLASNLNYGTIIASSEDQSDNCISEKYCYGDNPANCNGFGGLYQWNELMLYDDTPADQGFCPSAWHIPTENEWNTLFSNWINNGFAGSPLKFSGYSGFNALLAGTRHINKSWDFMSFSTFFWSSTQYSNTKAWSHGMNDYDPSVAVYPSSRANAFSVRCIHD